MGEMILKQLRELLTTMPGYTAETPLHEVRNWLRESVEVPSGELVTDRTVLARLPINDAATVLSTLESAAAGNIVVKYALDRLKRDGIDLSHDSARAMCDQLFSEPLCSAVKALGQRLVPRYAESSEKTDDVVDKWITAARAAPTTRTATVILKEKINGQLRVVVEFTDGTETFRETFTSQGLDADDIAGLVSATIDRLESRDAAATTLNTGQITL